MKRRMGKLWTALELPGEAFEADRRGVLERVNTALDTAPADRRGQPRRKLSRAVLVAAAALLLMGSALAAASRWDVLGLFFAGDTSPVQGSLQMLDLSVGNDQFTVTAEGYLSDYQMSFLLLTVTGHTEQARARLRQEDFTEYGAYRVEIPEAGGTVGTPDHYGYTCTAMKELDTDQSRSYRLMLDLDSRAKRAWLSFAFLPEEMVLELPLDRRVEGRRLVTAFDAVDRSGNAYRLQDILISPLTVQLRVQNMERPGTVEFRYFFQMADGSVRALNDMTINAYTVSGGYGATTTMVFRQVQEEGAIRAIIVDGTAFPLDGGALYAVAVDPKLEAFTMDLSSGVAVTDELYGPFYLPAEELCARLGGDYGWDEATGRATLRYRDVTLEMTAGSAVLLVDGVARTMAAPPMLREGVLYLDAIALVEPWRIDVGCSVVRGGQVPTVCGIRP